MKHVKQNIFLLAIIGLLLSACTIPHRGGPEGANNLQAPKATPPKQTEPGNPANPTGKKEETPELPKKTEDIAALQDDIAASLIDWKKNKDKLKAEIDRLVLETNPYSIAPKPPLKPTKDELIMRLANLNSAPNINEFKNDIDFSVKIITLVDSLVYIMDISAALKRDILAIREQLLTNINIKNTYYKLLNNKSDIEQILTIYGKRSDFDFKIYDTSVLDDPDKYSEEFIKWQIDSKLGKLDFTQIPSLSQFNNPNDPTNYCGYYALFNAGLLAKGKEAEKPQALDFINQFKIGLSNIRELRANSDLSGMTEEDLLKLAQIDFSELVDLSQSYKIEIANLDLDSAFMLLVTDEDSGKYIPMIISKFLEINKDASNVERQIFVGNTAKNGSHWMAFSVEKKDNNVYIKLLDSLGKNRQGLFKTWINELGG